VAGHAPDALEVERLRQRLAVVIGMRTDDEIAFVARGGMAVRGALSPPVPAVGMDFGSTTLRSRLEPLYRSVSVTVTGRNMP